jgi:hypothetical protein
MKNLINIGIIALLVIPFACTKPDPAPGNTTPNPPVVVTPPTIPLVTPVADSPEPTNDKELLEKIQKEHFRYFWDYGHPASGMARERTGSQDVVTTGGTGFGVMATVVAVSRNWVSRTEAVQRLTRICDFLLKSDRFHGVFPHWYNGSDGKVKAFSTKDDGGDLVETSFMIAGLLTAREFFTGNGTDESDLRKKIQDISDSVEWNWHVSNGKLFWHWSPKYNFEMNFPLKGYNETLITHVLAMASNKYAITKQVYDNTWNINKFPTKYYGYNLDMGEKNGGPLFFSHYSFLGLDPHQMEDKFTNYWKHSVNHTMINRAYCVYNAPKANAYSEEIWGLTSSDEPAGYSDHSASRDNGTVAPTGALSSMPYTPYYSMQALKGFYKNKAKYMGTYGFYDAFNTSANWVDNQHIAIDQGPIVVMIENYRSGLIWKLFMQIPEIKTALTKMEFSQPKYDGGFPLLTADVETKMVDLMKHPDNGLYEIDYLGFSGKVNIDLMAASGLTVEKNIVDNQDVVLTLKKISFDAKAGAYQLRLKSDDKTILVPVNLR